MWDKVFPASMSEAIKRSHIERWRRQMKDVGHHVTPEMLEQIAKTSERLQEPKKERKPWEPLRPWQRKAEVNTLANLQARIDKAAPLPWETVQLCRQMCAGAGHDPDQMVVDASQEPDGPLGSYTAKRCVPAWTLYRSAADAVRET